MAAMSDWRSFWDSEHSIYVNARHKDVHYRDIADQIAAFVPGPTARVLDYGCGDALHAGCVAAAAAEVVLADSAQSVRDAMAARDQPRHQMTPIHTGRTEHRDDHTSQRRANAASARSRVVLYSFFTKEKTAFVHSPT